MAEVKVKITAANQTQTGFQSVLADAQKTATQVQQTFARASTAPRMPQVKQPGGSGGPIDIDIGDYGLGPLRELQQQLKQAREAAQQAFDPDPPQQFSNGIGGVLGRFAIMIGVAATVGRVVASAFEQLSQAVKAATSVQEQFNQVLGEAGAAPTLDAAISGYKQLNSLADQTGKIIDETIGKDTRSAFASFFSAKPGQLLNRGADFLGLNFVTSGLRSQEQDQRSKAQQALLASLERQKLDAEALSASAGDPSATERIQREQRQREQRRRLDDQLRGNEDPKFIDEAKGKLEAAIAAENEAAATKDRLELEKEATKEKEKQTRETERAVSATIAAQQRAAQTERATAQIGMTPQERLAEERANQNRLQGEVAGASQGVEPKAEVAARVAELNAEIAASKQIQAQLEKQIADEAERAAKATAAAQRSAMASAQSQAQANRVATMTPQEQLDFEMQGLADLQGFVGPEVEAQKQAAIGRIMALQSQIQNQGQGAMVGSFGASALQRIGFASNEFFDTRRREDPEKETKRAADAAKEILKILQGGEPLVLPASN